MILSGKFTKRNGLEINNINLEPKELKSTNSKGLIAYWFACKYKLSNTQSPLFPHPPLKGGVL